MKKLILLTLILSSCATSDLDERLEQIYSDLHTTGSREEALELFPDAELIYIYEGKNDPRNQNIFPFEFYYSEEANITIGVCELGKTVSVCEGKLAEDPTRENYEECDIVEAYSR